MPNEEDYLDGLLSSITQKKSDIEEQKSREESDIKKKYQDSTRLSPDDDFLKETGLSDYRPSAVDRKNLRQAFSESGFLSDFEKTLNDGTADDFIRSFEAELEDDELSGNSSEAELSAFLDDDKKPAPTKNPSNTQGDGQENFNLDLSSANDQPFPDISTDEKPDEKLLSNIDEIVRNAKKQVEDGALVPPDEREVQTKSVDTGNDDPGFVSNLDMFSDGASNDTPPATPVENNTTEEPDLSQDFGIEGALDESAISAAAELENLFPDGDTSAREVPLMDDEGSDQDLLNILGNDGEFSDIGDLLTADANQEALPESTQQFEEKASSVSPGADDSPLDLTLSEEDGGNKKKGGFLGKLKGLFKKKKKGEEEPQPEEPSETPVQSEPVNINPINPSAAELSSESDDLLAEFGELPLSSEPEAAEENKEEEDGKKKKKDKKEKKKKGKKGKGEEGEEGEEGGKADKKADKKKKAEEKKAAKKAAKEAAKAADDSPVIPKKAIIVFAIFGISVAVFVTVLSKTINAKLMFQAAEQAYNKGEYNEAYTKFSGLQLKGDDTLYLDRSRILGTLDLHLKQYEVSMKYEKYDMALDSLIIGMESYEKNKDYAAELSITEVYDSFGKRIEEQLKDQFTLSKEDAHNIYNSKSRVEYSIKINRKLRELNLIDDPFKEEASE
ncbi:MAG: hypothetical protein ILP08_03005 [Lachnospiraceae bacterium]|nr:hypothetical protein [Lachnospiraceae bacterium]